MDVHDFIKRWGKTEAKERRLKDTFCLELCEVLGVAKPELDGETYVLEREAPWTDEDGRRRKGWMDLYKAHCFILEAKQGAWKRDQPKKDWVARASEPPPGGTKKSKPKPAARGTPGWRYAMDQAFHQAVVYSTTLGERPPFIIVTDIGYCFDLYACFDGTGAYRPFPDAQRFRFFLKELPEKLTVLKRVWENPYALNEQPAAEKATREIGLILESLAEELEEQEHAPVVVARFIMRCVFTMFASSIGLLNRKHFVSMIEENWIPNPKHFVPQLRSLWKAMDTGDPDSLLGQLLRFNGGLFADRTVLALNKEQLRLLLKAANANWRNVEPAIFGSMFQRALGKVERRQHGSHFTPRAYVERLLRPTVEEPLRARFDVVRQRAHALVESKDLGAARSAIDSFHAELCSVRVLDPACGTGNFLYVALDIMSRIEDEVLTLRAALDQKAFGTVDIFDASVCPRQFLGIEVDERAKEIADLVLWIGFLQAHYRRYNGMRKPREPVLKDYKNIECRDAVLAYDAEEPVTDGRGRPVTRWDGSTKKTSPLTGEEVPDSKAQRTVYRYLNARKPEWPAADFIVGNPPFLGNWRMRGELGAGYTEALRTVYTSVPDSADYVMYWWDRAAELVREDKVKRAGLITMTSITQTFNRRVVTRHLDAEEHPLSLVFAVADHPWTSAKYDQQEEGAAEVRTAMTVLVRGEQPGVLARVVGEHQDDGGEIRIDLSTAIGTINADLTIGVDVSAARPLAANAGLSCPGVKLHGRDFIISRERAAKLGLGKVEGLDRHIRPYLNGQDIASTSRDALVIDLLGLSEQDVRRRFPAVYQHVAERVKPERTHNARATYKNNWWLFGEPRKEFRPALEKLSRYIATPESARRRYFVFVDASILPDNMLVAIASDDAYVLGVLSSRVHTAFALRAGGRLGVRHDPRYNKTRCFEPFPFPDADETQRQRIADLAEQLDQHRKRQQAEHPTLKLTKLYKALAMVAHGEELTAKDRVVWEQGLGTALKSIHDDLDAAVLGAYGCATDLSDDEIVARLVELNAERVREEENEGLIRWLRPEFQQRQLTLPWPTRLSEQIAAVRNEIARVDRAWRPEELAALFDGATTRAIVRALVSLEEGGEAMRVEQADETRWRSLAKTAGKRTYQRAVEEFGMVAEPRRTYTRTPAPPPPRGRAR